MGAGGGVEVFNELLMNLIGFLFGGGGDLKYGNALRWK